MPMRHWTKGLRRAAEPPAGRRLGLAAGQGDATVLLPRVGLPDWPFSLSRVQEALGRPLYGPLALGVLVASTVAVVVVASGAPSILVQGSYVLYPKWLAGPLHGLFSSLLERPDGRPILPWQVVGWGETGVVILMLLAYGVALACARTLSMRAIAFTIAGLYAFLALSPPLELSDVFNYLGYAHLGALHGLNPYTHVIADERLDPVYWFVTWRNYPSPYGQVFTLLTYPLGFVSLAAGVWGIKIGTVVLMGAFVALVGRCARQLGHDPRFAVIFVALNPVIVLWDIGGFHNDPVMLVPMMAAISLLLARRYRWAGAALAVAIGVKLTIGLLLPFMMLAARPARRSLQVLLGTVLGLIPLAAISIAAFGLTMPNVSDQSIIVTPTSVVNLVGLLLHLGGASSTVEQASKVVMVLVVAGLLASGLRRGRPDWLSGAAWATLALLVCTAWLMPWYIVWALPLVAISTSLWLRRAMVAFMVFAALTFVPMTAMLLGDLHVNLMKSGPDQLATSRLWHFQHSPLPK
jgi:hypothetical protein